MIELRYIDKSNLEIAVRLTRRVQYSNNQKKGDITLLGQK